MEATRDFMIASAKTLNLVIDAEWEAAVLANLETLLKVAGFVEDFTLSTDAEPAPVFKA